MAQIQTVGKAFTQDGQKYLSFHFRTEQEARDFVEEMMHDPVGNLAAGVARLDSGQWRVVLGRHYDA
jgi:hypothetical protein